MMPVNFKPLRDYILVKLDEESGQTGQIQNVGDKQADINEGTVLATGKGNINPFNFDQILEPDIKPGDKVVFAPNAGFAIKIEGDGKDMELDLDGLNFDKGPKYLILKETEILGVRLGE